MWLQLRRCWGGGSGVEPTAAPPAKQSLFYAQFLIGRSLAMVAARLWPLTPGPRASHCWTSLIHTLYIWPPLCKARKSFSNLNKSDSHPGSCNVSWVSFESWGCSHLCCLRLTQQATYCMMIAIGVQWSMVVCKWLSRVALNKKPLIVPSQPVKLKLTNYPGAMRHLTEFQTTFIKGWCVHNPKPAVKSYTPFSVQSCWG